MSTVKFSELYTNCGINQTCLKYLNDIKKNRDQESLIKLIKCLSETKGFDSDLLTLQSNILLELSLMDDGYSYLDLYCEFLYNNIYKPWILSSKDHIDAYIRKFEEFVNDKTDFLLHLKKDTIYKNVSDNDFINGIKSLSVVFLILEYADELSSYGHEQQYSIVDKLNQILAEVTVKDETTGLGKKTFRKLATKRDLNDKRGLPKIYMDLKEYELGCNCLCNSMFVLSFLRILAKNGRLGKYTDSRLYSNVNTLKGENQMAGHTFIVVNLDPLDVKFNTNKKLYIECTVGWSEMNKTKKPLYKLEGQEFTETVGKMILRFLTTSNSIVNTYGDRMFVLDNSKIYLNNIREYLAKNPEYQREWINSWPDIFVEDVFDPVYLYGISGISNVQKIIVTLDYLKKFSKVKYLYPLYRDRLLNLFFSKDLAKEVKEEQTYRGVLLLEYLQNWSWNEQQANYEDLLEIIKGGRHRYGW